MAEPLNIVCVDDETNVLKSLSRIFLDTDYTIHTATSGDEGLEILRTVSPVQIVISDYRMPGMNGVDFLKEVCKHWPETIRIVLSGYADTAAIVGAVNEGQIYKFMPKPWNDNELKLAISNALDRYFINQQNIRLTKELEGKNKELQEINNNLEKIVTERTNDLVMQNKMLICSQNILDALPVGVLGIDPQDEIVQCNRKAEAILNKSGHELVGTDINGPFPDALKTFIKCVKEARGPGVLVSSNGANVRLKGSYMKYEGGQEGVILVLDKINDEG